ncbi:hypothetical protein SAMN05661010_02236 [Modicisalibacter muralis]|uniref:Uncharacterized protein n=2 Tax=Modicisalibacter muralis TaxID=119000 RepID=A0A1G9LZF8_9GAMM|nr:hypothetical protein SAMN05661010_02236 [Halomonas muralis]
MYSFRAKKIQLFLLILLLSVPLFSAIAIYAIQPSLVLLSFILLFVMAFNCIFLKGNDFFSPLTWFSFTYLGYVIGGLYYSMGGEYYGKFIELTGIPFQEVPFYMMISLLWATICYGSLCIGYSIFSRDGDFIPKVKMAGLFCARNFRTVSFVIIPLFLITGLLYWLYVAEVLAGNVISLIINFQAFRHLNAEVHITTLPYHFYYVGILLWLLNIVQSGKKVGGFFIFFSLIGFIIDLTQGQIMQPMTFLIMQVVFYNMSTGG